jgi:hypothetical protein
MGLPLDDWQFWVVTGVVVLVVGSALWRVVRFIRRGGRSKDKSVPLTIERKERKR